MSSQSHRATNFAAALVLIAASLHCPLEWQAAVRQMFEISRLRSAGEPLPIGMPLPGREDESGCICRGATLTQAVDLTGHATNAVEWSVLGHSLECRVDSAAESDARRYLVDECHAPPISGRQLRALYASLVI